ncbi:hypothetical protein A8924_6171 [Saccharopolyspora erythraea NRRL 2338]|uniref:Secreted protein n=1 Tax=Saccharopolyspora erythraea TaxID=1836 RepID=A0ABP3M7J3_SACER|nr:hypothetical protein [Saccharopolyspora erythraea]EQD88253.1 hypothetical protein N599_00205 [Saccharopolyspora erythraea D]PFG98650.1 hypothetical protein A8924_6171 [Saccharopolyspora erythraea NRRL 2338]QRK88677.1 hypothetical protein JQX30_29205 [Saccharopolyspora erythraea]
MLLIVLLLVLAAGGVLVGAVVVDRPEWAWASVLLCVLGVVLLVVDRARRRREASSSAVRRSGTEGEQPAPAVRESSDAEVEPAEEETDAADLLVVSELETEVVVIDERPRYHLRSCGWLGGREVLPLPVREARELGFGPCAQCSPDATLADRQRATASD